MKYKSFMLLILGASVSACVLLGGNYFLNMKESKAEECSHHKMEEYEAIAPTLTSYGEMYHYACCDCHQAWQDKAKAVLIGNTVTDRSKIDIKKKTTNEEIHESQVPLNDDVALADSNHVYGFDQTIWGTAAGGMGSGNLKYYEIDDRTALRLSTESLDDNKRLDIEAYNKGYSEIAFNKTLEGTITVKFDYKIYNLDTTTGKNQAKTEAYFYSDLEGIKDTTSSFDLITDNEWHTLIVSSTTKLKINSVALRFQYLEGEMYISNLALTSSGLDVPEIQQDGRGVSWNVVNNADYYVVHDDNNNPNEISIQASEANNGVLTYKPEAVGVHNIYVTAHSNSENFDPSTSKIIHDIEVDPVYFYDNFANEYYVDSKYPDEKTGLFNSKKVYNTDDINDAKGWGTVQTDKTYYHAYFTEAGTFSQNADERIRFNSSAAGSRLVTIVNEAKELGTNVLNISHNDGFLNPDVNLNEHAELLTIMDYAHANNLKVSVQANAIYSISASGKNEATIKDEVYAYMNNYGYTLMKHPAFYGFNLCDEPRPEHETNTIASVAHTARAVLDWTKENKDSKKLVCTKPYFVCDLLQYTGPSGLYCCEFNFRNYVETWLYTTGLNYYGADIYTYTTQTYGDDFVEVMDVNYDVLMDLKFRFPGVRMHLTTTANNDKYNRAACNAYDVYGSTYVAAAMNNYGISRYTYFPAIWTYHWQNGVVNRDGSHTSKYEWVKEAQSHHEFISDKLYGFEPIDFSAVSTGAYGAKSANTRRMDVTLSNGFDEYKMIVNYNSQADYVNSFTYVVPAGATYYVFKQGSAPSSYISNGDTVTLSNGQCLLITNESTISHTLSRINDYIERANSTELVNDEGYARFMVYSNTVENLYKTINPKHREKIVGYDTYLNKKEQAELKVGVLFNDAYYYLNGPTGTDYATYLEDPIFGDAYNLTFDGGRTQSIQLVMGDFLKGKDWSKYDGMGLYLKFDQAVKDRTYFIPNNWTQPWITPKTWQCLDEESHTYYVQFDFDSITGEFTQNTYLEIYFSPDSSVTISNMQISSAIYFDDKLNVDYENSLISKANNLSTASNAGKSEFILYSRTVDEAIAALPEVSVNKLTNYDSYLSKKESIFSSAGILHDKGYRTYNPIATSFFALTKNDDPRFTSMHKYTFDSAVTGSIQINSLSETNFIQDDWSEHNSVALFLRFDQRLNDKTYLIPNDWNQDWIPPTTLTLVDSGTNLYYAQFSLSTVTGAFTHPTYFQIYFGKNSGTDIAVSTVEVSDIVYFG